MRDRPSLSRLGESYCEREEWEKKTTKCVLRQIKFRREYMEKVRLWRLGSIYNTHSHIPLGKPLWAFRDVHTSLKTAGFYVQFKLVRFLFLFLNNRLGFFFFLGWNGKSGQLRRVH